MPKTKSIKICSWNVNGIRAVAKKGFHKWLNKSDFDIVCLQETKAQPDQLDSSLIAIDGYPFIEYNSAERKGYSGVANIIRDNILPCEHHFGFELERFNTAPTKIIEVDQGKKETIVEYAKKSITKKDLKQQILDFNSEGRVIETKHKLNAKESFRLFNIYFPNGGASTERLKFKLEFYEAFLVYIEELLKDEPNIVITGDYNTAHHAIDLARPKENTNTSGFMPVERVYLDRLEALGFSDSFRHFHPDKANSYTWWSFRTAARKRNIGWRIDYFYVSDKLLPKLQAAEIHSKDEGSDHCPISIELKV